MSTGLQGQVISDAKLGVKGLPFGTQGVYGAFASRGAGVLDVESFGRYGSEGCGDASVLLAGGLGGAVAQTNCGLLNFYRGTTVVPGPPDSGEITAASATESVNGQLRLFVGTSKGGVFGWGGDGDTFVPEGGGLPTSRVRSVTRAGSRLFAAHSPGLFSRRGTEPWVDASAGLPVGVAVNSVFGNDEILYTSLETGGIYRVVDAASMWAIDSAGVQNSPVRAFARSANAHFAAGSGGVFRKKDGGWIQETAGLPAGAVGATLSTVETGSRDYGYSDILYLGTAGNGVFSARPGPSVRAVPVLVDGAGLGGASFKTELTLGITSPAGIVCQQLPSWRTSLMLGTGTELRIPDATKLQSSEGILASPGKGLFFSRSRWMSSTNIEEFYALARVYAARPSGGTYGVTLEAPTDIDAAEEEGTVYGLQSSPGKNRVNLAVSHLPGRSADPITLEVRVFGGDGSPAPKILRETLAPGGFLQWTGVLQLAGLPAEASGYARISRVSGTGPWWAYGVVNDEVTSDGSLLPVYRPGGLSAVRRQMVPVVLDVLGAGGTHYTTELTLANDSNLPTAVDFTYRPGSGFGLEESLSSVSLALAAREQKILPDVLSFLRMKGLRIPEATSGPQAGTLMVWFRDLEGIDDGKTTVLARTTTPDPEGAGGGRFGVSYPAVAWGGGARWKAMVPGLSQDSKSRSNLGVVHTGGGSVKPLTLAVQLRDAATGRPVGEVLRVSLRPGEWYQWNRVIEQAKAPAAQATAWITRVEGDDTFFAYGVVNDAVTSDGSFIKMIRLEPE